MKARWIGLFLMARLIVQISVSAAEEKEVFGGIGVVLAQLYDQERQDHRGEVVVLGFSADSPAAKAGLQAGDVIVAVNGGATRGHIFVDLVQKQFRGPAGKALTLKIRRVGTEEPFNIKITRAQMRG